MGEKVVGKWWARGACPQCGAHTEEEAETLCRPSQTQDGEYVCAQPDEQSDAEGYLLQETPFAVAERDAWVDREVAKMSASCCETPDIVPDCDPEFPDVETGAPDFCRNCGEVALSGAQL
ncbi:hypothetical protein [Phenylobacterium sp.]|uniref:hypothetical protein n=1 Tax=Phenylobacterium sp. TaxID=1871053 RepID=UPI002737A29F|nr:hypothetical protein [Phenylobacterium sp.]MDP3869201.1 hypothetical protein [Phenylobacterium sp.]